MTKLTANPSLAITANGEYEILSEYKPGDLVTLECYASRGGRSIQPGLKDPEGNFLPVADPVTDATKPASWQITMGSTGILAVKIAGAGDAPAIKVATSLVPRR